MTAWELNGALPRRGRWSARFYLIAFAALTFAVIIFSSTVLEALRTVHADEVLAVASSA